MTSLADFEEFAESIKGKWEPNKIESAVAKKWPNSKDQAAYYKWSADQFFKSLEPPRPSMPMAELLPKIASTNYNNAAETDLLKRAINSGSDCGYLPFGTYINGDLYRVVLRTNALVNHSNPTTGQTLLPPWFLVVNTEPTLKSTSGHQKIPSDETDDTSSTSFSAFQLGQLEYFYGKDVSDPEQEDYWIYTGFCAVIGFTMSGRANGIYLIYDFYQFDPCSGMNSDRQEKSYDEDLWGYLPHSDVQFSCAKVIGEGGIAGLSQDFQFKISDIIPHEVGLARAVRTSLNTIVGAGIPVSEFESTRGSKHSAERPEEDESPTKKLHGL